MNINQAAQHPAALKFRIPGRPTPLARPRFGNNRVFDPQKDRKLITGISLRKDFENRPLFEGPIFLFMDFYFQIPCNWSKARKAAHMNKPYLPKPDTDNCIKYVLDSALGIWYDDDNIVCGILGRKLYGEPRTEIVILPWEEYEKVC